MKWRSLEPNRFAVGILTRPPLAAITTRLCNMEVRVARSRSSLSSSQSSAKTSSPETPRTSSKPTLSQRILSVLQTVDRPGEFSASGPSLTIPLGLHVDGMGDVELPLSAAAAKRLIKLCQQAPYGKGTETVVDTKVRKVWELGTDRFTIRNPHWDMLLGLVLREVEEKLGLPRESLEAHPYKLLVYEKGSFFLPHRDGEKIDRMVATLVINLPSKHTGGELVIQHQGQRRTIAMSGAASGSETEYAAFYADCEHEVRPVQSGYRLCLTYNLALVNTQSQVQAKAPDGETAIRQLEAILLGWSTKENGKKDGGTLDHNPGDQKSAAKLAVILDHQYSEEGLSIDNLKGVDLARANTLFDAAERAGCDAHLALVTLWQSGSAEGDEYHYSYSRRRYSRWDEFEDEDDGTGEGSSQQYSMGEVYEHLLTANHWSDRKGKKVAFGQIPIEEDEIVSAMAITDADPSREEFEGYTGNAGMTLERWYHKAAIVIWPRQNRLRIWCDAGTDAAIAGLQKLLSQPKEAIQDRESHGDECRRFARHIMETWNPYSRRSYGDPADPEAAELQKRNRAAFWQMLVELGSAELIAEAFRQVVPKDNSIKFPNSFLKGLDKQGWGACGPLVLSLFQQTEKENFRRNTAFFHQLATLPKSTSERTQLCREAAPLLLEAIERTDAERRGAWYAPSIDRKEFTVEFAGALAAIGDEKLLSRFLEWLFRHARYDHSKVQIPAALQLASSAKDAVKLSPAIQNWIQRLGGWLQQLTSKAPEKPTDWRRPSQLNCHCVYCGELSAFLADPTREVARFPLAKQRRQHLHDVIERNHCDCTHETLRVGSPQTLVCKKTNGSYDRACEDYQRNLRHLNAIRKIIAKF